MFYGLLLDLSAVLFWVVGLKKGRFPNLQHSVYTVDMKIPLMRHGFFRDEQTRAELAQFVCNTERFSMHTHCAEFERAFATWQECTHAIFVSSGSAANLVLIQSLLNLGRLKKGDKVGVSAITWATNIMPLFQLGLVPVLIDCELDTLNISSRTVQPHIASLQAIFITNVLGFCDDLPAIAHVCIEHNVLLIEDNCESLGSRIDGKLLGNFGVASTFSTFVGHHLSTIEGGFICTEDEDLADMCLMVRAHGWDRSVSEAKRERLRAEHKSDAFQALFTFYDLAYNTRPTEINGFLGITQLPLLTDSICRREQNYLRFFAAAQQNPDIFPLRHTHMGTVSNFAMPVICRTAEAALALRKKFMVAEVEVRPVVAGDMSAQPFYRRYGAPAVCANAAHIHTCGFYFPNNSSLTEAEVDYLCSLLLP